MNEIIANISTAPAAVSFAILAFSLLVGLIISTVLSIDVFMHSAEVTNPISIKQTNHSVILIFNMTPNIITNDVISRCIFIFLSNLIVEKIPIKA